MKDKKKSNQKIFITFLVVLVIIYSAGYILGSLVAKGEKSGNLEAVLTQLKGNLTEIVPPLFLILAVASLITVTVLYFSCKKMYKEVMDDKENEVLWDILEKKLNYPLILANVMSIVNVFFLGSIIYIAEFNSYGRNSDWKSFVVAADIILFVVIMVVTMAVSKGIVTMEKKLNPEKQGDVFDFRFNKVWLDSCDEAQKLIIYKSGYRAFQNSNMACIILWVMSFMGMFIFRTGIYPLLCVCIIWLVNSLSYQLHAVKLENGK